jgi:hypothetical protein
MMDHDIRLGRIGSFIEIAGRKAQGERRIRLLALLAFLSPRIIAAIVVGPHRRTLWSPALPKPSIQGPSRSALSHEMPRLSEPAGKKGV